MPSRPVRLPTTSTGLPAPAALLVAMMRRSCRCPPPSRSPGSYRDRWDGSKSPRPPWARPRSCRRTECRPPRRAAAICACSVSRSPKRSESSSATGRAPMVKMSRRMPPMPVAAPCSRLDLRGVVVAFHFEEHIQAVGDLDAAGILAFRAGGIFPRFREELEQRPAARIAAVLRPLDGIHRQLGRRRLASEDLQHVLGIPARSCPVRGRPAIVRYRLTYNYSLSPRASPGFLFQHKGTKTRRHKVIFFLLMHGQVGIPLVCLN